MSIVTSIIFVSVLVATTCINAAGNGNVLGFNYSVPTMQGMKTLGARSKYYTTDVGYVKLPMCEPTGGVTFYPYQTSVGKLTNGKTVKKSVAWVTVPYGNTYGQKVVMNCDFRNTNWSLNHNRIAGEFDYQ